MFHHKPTARSISLISLKISYSPEDDPIKDRKLENIQLKCYFWLKALYVLNIFIKWKALEQLSQGAVIRYGNLY